MNSWSLALVALLATGTVSQAFAAEVEPLNRKQGRNGSNVAMDESRVDPEVEETARLNREIAAFAAQEAADTRKAADARVEYEREMERVRQARTAYEKSMEAHQRDVEEANRRQQEYLAAQRRHSQCINGDKKACKDIEAGKPALADRAPGTVG